MSDMRMVRRLGPTFRASLMACAFYIKDHCVCSMSKEEEAVRDLRRTTFSS